jgi:hypothetical protein
MAYHNRVIGRMVSTLWFQLATTAPSATGGGGVSPGTPPTIFGVPEHIPEMTYVSTSGSAGFLNDAVAYHAIYGLNGAGLTQPGRIDSLEDLIDKLRPDSSHIGRLRVVSHVGLNTTTIEANMNLPFFNGGPAFIWRQLLEGFAIDDVTGLRAIIDPSNFQHPSAPFFNSLVSESIDILRIIDPDVLAPFSLESSGSPSGDLELFFFACSDKLFAALAERDTDYCELTFNGSALNNTERNNLNNSLDIIANALKDRISGGSSTMNTNLEHLRAAIASLNFFLLMARLPNFVNLVSPILDALRDDVATQPLLVPFGLGDSGSPTPPGSDQAFFFNICSDLLYVHLVRGNPSLGTIELNGTALSPQQNHDLDAALNRILETIKQRLMHGTFTEQQLTDLHDAILRLDMGTLHLSSLGTSPSYGNFSSRYYRGTPLFTVTDAVGALITALNSHTIPAGLREAFTEHSIDISGATVTQLDADNGWLLRKGSNEYFVRSDEAGTTLYIHSKTPNPFAMLGQANTAIGNNFRAHLDTVRARFDEHSWVDIRGCRIGQDRDYLVALRNFFGGTANQPAVSGPTWYQSFPPAGYVGRITEQQIDDLWDHGFTNATPPINHSALAIQDTFDKVSPLAGIDIHIDFWERLTNGETFAFVALVWKGSLPQLPIEANRLDGFLALDLSDTMTRLSQIFDVSAPAAATFNRIEAKHAQMAALQTEIETIVDLASQASPPPADLTASFNRLHTISQQLSLTTVPATPPASLQVSHLQTYSQQLKRYFEIVTIPNGPDSLYQAYLQIEALAAQASPPAADLNARFSELQQIQDDIGASGIVPATEPASGTDEERRNYATQLQGYVDQLTNHLNSAADMVTFKDAVHTKTQHARAAFRYYFFIGMPLLIDEYQNEYYYYFNALGNQAIRSFMHAQWQEPLPAGNHVGSATMAQANPRRVSVLSEDQHHGPDPRYGGTDRYYIDPYPEFDEHIEKVP